MKQLDNCDSCTKPTNNAYFNCPPRMSDGRHFTNYQPKCSNFRNIFMIEEDKGFKYPPANSYDHRQYLIHNGEKLMELNREEAFQKNMCGPCSIDPSTMLPEQTKIACNANSCKVELNDTRGLGQGRKYQTQNNKPDVKREKISNSSFEEKKQAHIPKSCCTSSLDDANYYPLDGKIEDDYGRLSIPSGGIPLRASDRI